MTTFDPIKFACRRLLPLLSATVNRTEALGDDEGGAVAVIAALAFPVLIGGVGLGAEVGYWYLKDRELQHIADLSAYAAAVRLNNGGDDDSLDAVALHIATQSGFAGSSEDIEVHHPPVSGDGAGNEDMVEVVLSEDIERSFSSLFGSDAVSLESRAVAEISGGDRACVLALAATASGAISASGSSALTLQNCSAASNSSSASGVSLSGSARITATCVYSHGGFTSSASSGAQLSKCDAVEVNADSVADPYANVVVPTAPAGSCTNFVNTAQITASGTLANGLRYRCYNSLSFSGNAVVTFENNAVYFITGNFTASGNTRLSGSGVTFVVGGNVNFSGTTTMNFTAPAGASHPYRGLLFFGDRDATIETHSLSGNDATVFQGALYFPTANLTYSGSSSGTTTCTQIIANKIQFSGNSGIGSDCDDAGTKDITTGQGGSVKLAE